MPISLWSQDYWTGHADIDRQHQTLFALINTLHEAMMEGQGDQVVYQTLQELANYTIDHFATEEALMLAQAYPDYDRPSSMNG
ncbi:MAG: hemerythrin domain-containing protein [Prochlorothrix sp.]